MSITVSGKVQGVWFRKYAANQAHALGVQGFVTNQADGTVLAVATGTLQQIEAFVNACKKGPPLAHVQELRTEVLPLQFFEGFQILR